MFIHFGEKWEIRACKLLRLAPHGWTLDTIHTTLLKQVSKSFMLRFSEGRLFPTPCCLVLFCVKWSLEGKKVLQYYNFFCNLLIYVYLSRSITWFSWQLCDYESENYYTRYFTKLKDQRDNHHLMTHCWIGDGSTAEVFSNEFHFHTNCCTWSQMLIIFLLKKCRKPRNYLTLTN